MTEEVKPIRVHIHPELELEFQHWKTKLEEKAGKKLEGGRPIISKLCAEILKTLRLEPKTKRNIIIEIRKIPRVGKYEVFFL